MNKEDFVLIVKDFKKDISTVAKQCEETVGKQIRSRVVLDALESLGAKWFDLIDQPLSFTYQLSEEVLKKYRDAFGKLLESSGAHPAKGTVLGILQETIRSYHTDILVPVQKRQAIATKFPNLDILLSHAEESEFEYLKESIECARFGKQRAAIILGWCAAIDRLQRFVEKEGFDKFNHSSIQMSAVQSGRYKRFNKKFEIHNLSDLRMTVLDGDLLWLLEFMGTIDGNQHERFEICFTMRNTCAHPGDSVVTDENLLSFFSDVDSLVFSNPKFSLSQDKQ